MRWFLLSGTAFLAVLIGSCGDDDEVSIYPGFVALTITRDGVTVEPAVVDWPSLYLEMENQTDELISIPIQFHGQDVEPLEFGLAPRDFRRETIREFEVEGMRAAGMRLEWENDALHVYLREVEPTPTLFQYAATTSGCDLGHSHGHFILLAIGNHYFTDAKPPLYGQGYRNGYIKGLADGLFGDPEEIPEILDDDGTLYLDGLAVEFDAEFYVRGHEDGYGDGCASDTRDASSSQVYRREYYEGFVQGVFDEENQCESLETRPAN